MATMDDAYPSLLRTYRAQIDKPNIGSTRSNEQTREALRIGKMRFVQMEATTLLIREKCLDPKSLAMYLNKSNFTFPRSVPANHQENTMKKLMLRYLYKRQASSAAAIFVTK